MTADNLCTYKEKAFRELLAENRQKHQFNKEGNYIHRGTEQTSNMCFANDSSSII